MTRDIPKAERHCHLEGTAPPALVRRLARLGGTGRRVTAPLPRPGQDASFLDE